MKSWVFRLKAVLCSNKGESITESLASVLVLSIMFVGITTILTMSLRITSTLTADAKATQETTVNTVVKEDYETGAASSKRIYFSSVYALGEDDILGGDATHEVSYIANGIVAYIPMEE